MHDLAATVNRRSSLAGENRSRSAAILAIDFDAEDAGEINGRESDLLAALRAARYDVTSVHGPRETVARLLADPCDLALIDGRRDGAATLELLAVIRELRSSAELSIVACLAEEVISAALAQGANDCLTGAGGVDLTLVRIAAHLELAQARVALQRQDGDGNRREESPVRSDRAPQNWASPVAELRGRDLFRQRVEACLEPAVAGSGAPFAVIFLDLNDFKRINGSLGHRAGDQLLAAVGERLVRNVRVTDCVASASSLLSVARIGGDDFTVLLEGVGDAAVAEVVAQRLLDVLAQPFSVDGRTVSITASVGIALGPGQGKSADDLLHEADAAMYCAKAVGPGRYCVFDEELRHRAAERMALEHDLRDALAKGELTLYYQPIVALEDERIVGGEALLRWIHPTRGFVSPADFIPIAEQTGLILAIGRFVLQTAIAQAAQWHRQYSGEQPLLMSVNVSCKQLVDAGLADYISDLLAEVDLDPACLKIEVTESTLMENPAQATAILAELRSRGVQVGLDDFGTGYSCLALLHRLPLDVLKVDRSFVSDMTEHEPSAAIVRTVLSLAESLGLAVIAEGVETAEQAQLLRDMGCPWSQGYYFSRPVDAAAFESLLSAAAAPC